MEENTALSEAIREAQATEHACYTVAVLLLDQVSDVAVQLNSLVNMLPIVVMIVGSYNKHSLMI